MARNIETSRLTDLALGKLPPDEALRLMEELEKDPEASRELDQLVDLTRVVNDHGAEVLAERSRVTPGPEWPLAPVKDWIRSLFRVPAFAAIVCGLLVVVGSVIFISHRVAGPYEELARITDEIPEYAVRGSGDQDLSEAMQLMEEGNYAGSVKICERYMKIHPEEESVSYASYVAGVGTLLSARHTLLTLFPSYDRALVTKGMEYLARAVRVSPNRRIQEEALWLRAKGFLMLNEPAEAEAELKKVIDLRGTKSERAAALLAKIQNSRIE